MKAPSRLQTAGFQFALMEGGHHLSVSIGYDTPEHEPIQSGHAIEIAFTTRGKIGHQMDMLLQELGMKLSRALQGRDPDTGAELDAVAASYPMIMKGK